MHDHATVEKICILDGGISRVEDDLTSSKMNTHRPLRLERHRRAKRAFQPQVCTAISDAGEGQTSLRSSPAPVCQKRSSIFISPPHGVTAIVEKLQAGASLLFH